MKSIIPYMLSASLMLAGSIVLAGSETSVSASKSSHTAVTHKKAPSFLFVIQAKKGEIKKNKAGHYELILNKADVNHVIMFSDRPYRIVKHITGKNLAADWSVGSNSFKVDPPNAVLSANGMKAEIIILSSMQVKGRQIIFGLHGTPKYSCLDQLTITVDTLLSAAVWGTNY